MKRRLRIASLVPAATEIVAALGASDDLVAISHECDYPPEIRDRPRITASAVDASVSSGGIDEAVRAAMRRGEPVIGVDREALRRADPDVILVQVQCEVCAVDGRAVRSLANSFEHPPRLVTLAAGDMAGVYEDVRRVGLALGRSAEAEALVVEMAARTARLAERTASRSDRRDGGNRPRVVCIEWIDPVYLAGHWVPELIAAAGGHDVGAAPGAPSRRVEWTEVEALRPDVLVIALCGFDEARGRDELGKVSNASGARLLASVPTVVIDGNAYTSRSGPRLPEGAEKLAAAFERLAARTIP